MKISTRQVTWMAIGFGAALLCGVPATADDTELLLINPDPTQNPKPNVLFILDTSGSMDGDVSTIDPYDSTETYTDGDCDPDRMYWTDVDVTPVCDSSNTQYIEKSSFHCQYAANQISGIGSFQNTMVQYRDGGKNGGGTGPARWQYLAPGYHTEPVECQADSGVHGDGRSTHLWAANGTNLTDPFADSASAELSWGSAPRNIGYTFFDGNYLNWKNSPDTVTLTRLAVVQAVTKAVLGSVNNLNVGLMRFNHDQGGPVMLAMQDLDDNRADILAAIDTLDHEGNTPLSETLYESARYWLGMSAHFGESDPDELLAHESTTDPAALLSSDPDIYRPPASGVCSKNYNVLLTDGKPVNDKDTPGLAPGLPDFGDTLAGRTACTDTEGTAGTDNDGHCLDDVAEYLSKKDIDSVMAGDQVVTTHTIGFAIDLPLLEETAYNSGGEYFQANDVESLTRTMLEIIANINDRTLSFTAPAAAVNTFNRAQNLNDLYISTFGARAKVHWPGNLKKYSIDNGQIVDKDGDPAVDPNTGFFSDESWSFWTSGSNDGNEVRLGGAANELPDPDDRKLFTNRSGTNLSAATNAISLSNADSFTDAEFGLSGATGEPTKEQVIRWARGEDVQDEDNNSSTTVRYAMGDPLHSQPAAVSYGGTPTEPEMVIYTATNDGYLHAIAGDTGEELWSFIPKELLSNLTRLYFDPNSRYKQYGIDGNVVPVVKDVDKDGIIESADGDFVYILFGMRRGGSSYYALDVTDKDAPDLLWTANLPEFGESWSTPTVTRMKIDSVTQNSDEAVVIIGGGYDTVHDTSEHPAAADGIGAGVHILDLVSGARLWRAGPDSGADLQLTKMTRAMPNRMRVVDLSGDGFADRMYTSDMGGQIWRFDIFSGSAVADLVTGGVIARLGAEGTSTPTAADTRRFYNTPDLSIITDKIQQRRFIAMSIGSGYRAHPFDLAASDRFYSLRDPDVFNKLPQSAYDTYSITNESQLVEVSGKKQVVITASDRGWKFTIPTNQKVLSDSLTFNDEIFFVAFSPDSNAAATCAAGQGTNFLYRMKVVNGDPVVSNLEDLDPADADDARREALQQGGIAPSPAILFPSPEEDCTGDACSPNPIACVGVECFSPGFTNNPVRTLWTQDGIQ